MQVSPFCPGWHSAWWTDDEAKQFCHKLLPPRDTRLLDRELYPKPQSHATYIMVCHCNPVLTKRYKPSNGAAGLLSTQTNYYYSSCFASTSLLITVMVIVAVVIIVLILMTVMMMLMLVMLMLMTNEWPQTGDATPEASSSAIEAPYRWVVLLP